MAVYKVIQDIEAEDKLFVWMTLRQFIAFCISAASMYVIVMVMLGKIPPIVLPIIVPIAIVTGLFAAPLSRVQPTEVWLAARLRFLLKPRRRIWNQSGVQELVTITAPKQETHTYQNSLSQTEVESRLTALAHTLDSRGWAVKNVNLTVPSMAMASASYADSDRLVPVSVIPREVPNVTITASDDIMDPVNPIAQRFDQQVRASSQRVHDGAVTKMQSTMQPVQDNPFLAPPILVPTQDDTSSMPPIIATTSPTTDSIRIITPPTIQDSTPKHTPAKHTQHTHKAEHPHKTAHKHDEEDAKESKQTTEKPDTAKMTDATDPAILELAHNNDFSVATIAKQANRKLADDHEVTIKLR